KGQLGQRADTNRDPRTQDQLEGRLRPPVACAGGDDGANGRVSRVLLVAGRRPRGPGGRGDEPGRDPDRDTAIGGLAGAAGLLRGHRMTWPEPLVFASALATALVAGFLVAAVAPPPRRLRSRVSAYVTPRAQLRDGFDGVFARVFGPLLGEIAERLGAILDRGAAAAIALRLRQAGRFRAVDEHEAGARDRMRLLGSVALGGVIGLPTRAVASGTASTARVGSPGRRDRAGGVPPRLGVPR